LHLYYSLNCSILSEGTAPFSSIYLIIAKGS